MIGTLKIRVRECGFTLLEILMAAFIFSIIATTIFGSFRAVFSTTETLHSGMEAFEMVSGSLDRMTSDITSACVATSPGYFPPKGENPPDPYRIVGDSGPLVEGDFARLRFASYAHLPMGKERPGGIAQIVYYVEPAEENRYVLKRADHLPPYPDLEEPGNDPILIEGIKSLKFLYYDTEGTEHETWDSESQEFKYATPTAIRIRVEIGDDSGSFFFETMVNLPIVREPRE